MGLEMGRLPRFVHVGPNNHRYPSKRKVTELESEKKMYRWQPRLERREIANIVI